MDARSDPIKHVIVLMLENRSFDQMLGALKEVYPGLDGVDPQSLFGNKDDKDKEFEQAPTTTHRIQTDPKHDLKCVLEQIGMSHLYYPPKRFGVFERIRKWLSEGKKFDWELIWDLVWLRLCAKVKSWLPQAPSGPVVYKQSLKQYESRFVLNFSKQYPKSKDEERKEIMGYYPLNFLSAHHALAREFTVCDRWFSSVPGPTWANRLFIHSGTAAGRVTTPEGIEWLEHHPYTQETIYDRLTEKGITWKIYYDDVPQSLVLSRQLNPERSKNYFRMDQFYTDAGSEEASFPAYCFIEPKYFDNDANDDHPPHDTMLAQALTANVYNALRANPQLWNSTLFVIIYDEHGGFFDHVEPGTCDCPDELVDDFKFNYLGVRVPAILVSPWVDRGVNSMQFDHTSVLRYICDKWQLAPLGNRVAQATSIGCAIRDNAREDTIHRIDIPQRFQAMAAGAEATLNDNQQALADFTDYLETHIDDLARKPARLMMAKSGIATAKADVAKVRVADFLDQQKRKAAEASS